MYKNNVFHDSMINDDANGPVNLSKTLYSFIPIPCISCLKLIPLKLLVNSNESCEWEHQQRFPPFRHFVYQPPQNPESIIFHIHSCSNTHTRLQIESLVSWTAILSSSIKLHENSLSPGSPSSSLWESLIPISTSTLHV